MSGPSITNPEFDQPREHPGFTCQRSLLGRQAGSEKTGLSLWSLPPGEAAYPYHWHFATEETIVVLEGAPSLRTPAGWSELAEGDVVCFQAGEGGAHQITKRTDGRVRFLSFSNQQPDAVVYPDSGKLLAAEARPDGDGTRHIFRIADEVDYYDGEEAPRP